MRRRSRLQVDPRTLLLLISALLPVLFAVGVYAFWPIIKQETHRREWWENVWASSEDAVATFWYLWFLGGYLRHRSQENASAQTAAREIYEWRRVALSMIFGAIVSGGSVLWSFYSEKAHYRTGVKTVASGFCVRAKHFTEVDHYKTVCRFADRTGAQHDFWLIVVDPRSRPPAGFPDKVISDLRRGRTQMPIPIRYDSDRPQRAWIEGTGGEDENGYDWFSLTILMFQMMGLALFALIFLPRLCREVQLGRTPWWAGAYKIAPLAIEAVFLGLFGLLELLVGRM